LDWLWKPEDKEGLESEMQEGTGTGERLSERKQLPGIDLAYRFIWETASVNSP